MVSVLNKEKGSSASQVLKRLGFRGKYIPSCILDLVAVVFCVLEGISSFLVSSAHGLYFALQVSGKVCLLVSS